MPLDLLIPREIVIAIAAVLGVGLLLVLLLWWAMRARQRQIGGLQRLGFRVTRSSPLLAAEGNHRGRAATIEEVFHHHRRGTSQSTRIVMTGGGTVEAALSSTRGSPVSSGEPAGMRQIPTGDPTFDACFRAFASDDRGAALWRDQSVRARVMALGARGLPGDLVELHLARGQVRVVLGMAGLPEQKLRDALELGAALLDLSGHAPRPWPYAVG